MSITNADNPQWGAIDELVLAVLKEGVPLILGWDGDLSLYIIAEYIEDIRGGERPVPRVEYQVSDGLPGDRASSEDYSTFAEASKAFDEMCEAGRAARRESSELRLRHLFGLRGGTPR